MKLLTLLNAELMQKGRGKQGEEEEEEEEEKGERRKVQKCN
jgi:hypothetical protein